jgi:hypothetical protein
VITAAITAAVAAVLSVFGIKPGPYLVVVAAVVKGIIVLTSVLLGTKFIKAQAAKRNKPPGAVESAAAGPATPPAAPET